MAAGALFLRKGVALPVVDLSKDAGQALGNLGGLEGGLARGSENVAHAESVKLADSLRSEAIVHYLGGDKEKALKALDESIKLHDGDPGAFFERGRLHQELRNQTAADADYLRFTNVLAHQTVLELHPGMPGEKAAAMVDDLGLVPSSADTVRNLYLSGDAQLSIGAAQRGIVQHTKDLESSGTPVEMANSLLGRANSYERLGRTNLAMNDIYQAMALTGRDATDSGESLGLSYRAFIQRSRLNEQLGNKFDADLDYLLAARVRAHQTVMKVNPDMSFEAATTIVDELHLVPPSADAARKIDDIERAQRRIVLVSQELEGAAPASKAFALRSRAESYEELGHNDLALRDLNESLDLKGDDYTALEQRSRVNAKVGDTAGADADYLEYTKVLARENVLWFHENMPKEQVTELMARLNLVPASADAARGIGNQIGNVQRSIVRNSSRIGVGADPVDEASSLLERANSYGHIGHNDLALSDLEQSIRLRPDNAATFWARHRIYEKLGDQAAANADKAEYTRLSDLAYKDRALPAILPSIEFDLENLK